MRIIRPHRHRCGEGPSSTLRQIVPVRRTDVGQTCGTYLDFAGNIGIVGIPVIDPLTQTIYFVVRTKESGVFRQRLHALDIRDGSPRPNSPTLIQATATGSGAGSVGGTITFDHRTQNQRPGLMLLNGVVYIAWASHCDQLPYQGWVLGYDASNLSQVMSLNVAPDGTEAGNWQSGQALSADALGNIYARPATARSMLIWGTRLRQQLPEDQPGRADSRLVHAAQLRISEHDRW